MKLWQRRGSLPPRLPSHPQPHPQRGGRRERERRDGRGFHGSKTGRELTECEFHHHLHHHHPQPHHPLSVPHGPWGRREGRGGDRRGEGGEGEIAGGARAVGKEGWKAREGRLRRGRRASKGDNRRRRRRGRVGEGRGGRSE